jgi:hypothetical protein
MRRAGATPRPHPLLLRVWGTLALPTMAAKPSPPACCHDKRHSRLGDSAGIGEVIGLTVRPNNALGLKRIIGVELQGLIKNLAQSRREAMGQLVAEAQDPGGNAGRSSRCGSTSANSATR